MTTATTNAQPRRKAPSTPRPPRLTKKAQLIRLLGVAAGADVITISTKLGWQTHTVRAALSGLRKAGYEVVAAKSGQDRPARYRIVETPAKASADAAATKPREIADAG